MIQLHHLVPTETVRGNSSVEEIVATIWKEVLAIDSIGPDEHFVEIGGQSLQAVIVVSRIMNATGIEVSYPRFMEAATIRQVARLLDQAIEKTAARGPHCVEEGSL